jgi:hypothetical protein
MVKLDEKFGDKKIPLTRYLERVFPRKISKAFGRHHRRRLLYPRNTFMKLLVPTMHLFENIYIHGVHLRFALHVAEGVATGLRMSRKASTRECRGGLRFVNVVEGVATMRE